MGIEAVLVKMAVEYLGDIAMMAGLVLVDRLALLNMDAAVEVEARILALGSRASKALESGVGKWGTQIAGVAMAR